MTTITSNSGASFLQYCGFLVRFPLLLLFLLFTSLLVPVATAGSSSQGQSPDIPGALARIDSLLASGAVQPALEEARQLQAEHEDDPYHGWQIDSRLGVALLRSGDPLAAIPWLENAIRKAPAQAENHRNLGAALVQLGRRGRALSEYAQAVELAPLDFEMRLEYGQLLLDFRDIQKSREQLLTANHLCGGCPQIKEPLARMYLASGEFASAVPILFDLFEQNEPSPGMRRSLIQALQGAGQDSLLLNFLERSEVVDLPADEVMLLVNLEGKLGRPENCEVFAAEAGDIEPAVSQVPASVAARGDFWGQVSYNLLVAEINGAALAALDRALLYEPDNVVYRNNRVVLLSRLGRHDEAAKEWQKALTLDPTLEERTKK